MHQRVHGAKLFFTVPSYLLNVGLYAKSELICR